MQTLSCKRCFCFSGYFDLDSFSSTDMSVHAFACNLHSKVKKYLSDLRPQPQFWCVLPYQQSIKLKVTGCDNTFLHAITEFAVDLLRLPNRQPLARTHVICSWNGTRFSGDIADHRTPIRCAYGKDDIEVYFSTLISSLIADVTNVQSSIAYDALSFEYFMRALLHGMQYARRVDRGDA